ncbi:hypothetical protein M595_0726 [Lyngbya aestuarii BL J]|uniref:Uncharacterized protein n=1 Tax=Lyngbya aestuarii BL J TaxID=1348334 RepID=U7QMY7_9CYAN|nr:hypothetical protein M595_0726 [Lyngbya aestuarii BL J]
MRKSNIIRVQAFRFPDNFLDKNFSESDAHTLDFEQQKS